WSELRPASLDLDLYAARLNADGSQAWNGTSTISDADNSQRAVAGAPDGQGGAFLAWDDFRPLRAHGFALPHVFAQHLKADGTPGWIVNGQHMGGAGPSGYESQATMVSDDQGGFWLA